MSLLCFLLAILSAMPVYPQLEAMSARAERGDSVAMWNMGLLYERGYGDISPDSVRALGYFRRSAEKGYPPALNLMGYRIYSGLEGTADHKRGIEMIRRAADAGDPGGCTNLGWLLIHGEGLAHDTIEGARLLRKGAMRGLPRAAVQYADLCRYGAGTPRNLHLADSLYEAALSKGFAPGGARLVEIRGADIAALDADSAAMLARRYYGSAYPALGVAYARRGAAEGSPLATAILADATAKGRGTAYDHDLSLNLYARAAMLGDASALFILSELLTAFPDALTGIAGCDDDPASLRRRAAEKGVRDAAEAMRRLGLKR